MQNHKRPRTGSLSQEPMWTSCFWWYRDTLQCWPFCCRDEFIDLKIQHMHNFEVFSHYDMIISMWWLQMLQCLYDKCFISTVANNETKVNLSYSTKLISMQITHFQYSLIQYLGFFLAWLCLILYILSAENGVLMSWQKTWFCCINTPKIIKVYNVYMIV